MPRVALNCLKRHQAVHAPAADQVSPSIQKPYSDRVFVEVALAPNFDFLKMVTGIDYLLRGCRRDAEIYGQAGFAQVT